MKKFMTAALMLVLFLGIFAPAALQAGEIGVTIDGVAVDFEGQPPTIVEGRTLVPVRGVFEALGFTVDWEQETQTATLSDDNYVVIISIGSDVFTTNGEEFELDVPAQIIEGRTLLPIRAVLESVGFDVDWDGVTSTVVVTTPPVPTQAQEAESEDSASFNFELPRDIDFDRLAANAEFFSWVTVQGGLWDFGPISLGENGVIGMTEHGVTAISVSFTPEEAAAIGLDASVAALFFYYTVSNDDVYFLRSFTTFHVCHAGTSAMFEIPVLITPDNSFNVIFYMGQEKPNGYVYSVMLIIDFNKLDEAGLAALEEFSSQVGYNFLRTAITSMNRFFGVHSFVDGILGR